mmetsp:Transcript_30667/g.88517  ORF Transcript_30667/g.88517 Transcript_30667/m.88517 type:complete len:249 (+) Transcript_30667:160-906(+)
MASAQISADEQLARDLQQQEMQQAQQWSSGVVAPQGGPIVTGTVVGPAVGHPPPTVGNEHRNTGGFDGGGPVLIGQPAGLVDMPRTVIMVDDVPVEEVIVLRYRCSTVCFASIDAVSTVLIALTAASVFGSFGQLDSDDDEKKIGPGSFGLLGLVLLVGPFCGVVGARQLHPKFVMVYLIFCFIKLAYDILLVVLMPSLWYVVTVLIHIWVSKIIFTFWRALGRLSPERRQEMLRPEGEHRSVRMSIW